ncbi:MarR family winged helix-turn-helix transcriptional regulator [Candidatus Formimonas warabiya]|uniref:MarR family transcriptional regulator n=1 Tax=Formimonas warabiya TaxID=1761012 RepID=A0A3G1KYE7_FORW1|nr:MarR family transcriptional regulator [Candidatus Formimonas warabiya]ATW27471.1 MarR family transcriptional regulator [Candidatus Formimonas warabiya]
MLTDLTYELFRFYNGFASWEGSVIKASDLSVSETHAIEILGEYGQMNMRQLAEKLGVTTGTITVTVDRLEKKEYARRQSTLEDRRVYIISLTDKGKQVFEEHHQYHLSLTEQILSVLTEEESNHLLSIAKKLNNEVF